MLTFLVCLFSGIGGVGAIAQGVLDHRPVVWIVGIVLAVLGFSLALYAGQFVSVPAAPVFAERA